MENKLKLLQERKRAKGKGQGRAASPAREAEVWEAGVVPDAASFHHIPGPISNTSIYVVVEYCRVYTSLFRGCDTA